MVTLSNPKYGRSIPVVSNFLRQQRLKRLSGGDIPVIGYSAEYLLNAETITLPFTLNGHTTDWGDGTINTLDTHTYSSGGTYVVTSTGAPVTDLLYYGHALAPKLLRVLDGSAIQMTDLGDMFRDCNLLTAVVLFDTSSVTNMAYTFYGCTSLTSVPLLDTSGVTNMIAMFLACTALTSVPLFDTSSVTNMSFTFYSCNSLITVPLFDTSSVTDMKSMFFACTSLTTVPLFDTSSVTNMSSMFNNCALTTASYSAWLVHINTYGTSGVTLGGGSSLYNSSAVSARADLVSRGWTVADGGLE
jgi:surface protein